MVPGYDLTAGALECRPASNPRRRIVMAKSKRKAVRKTVKIKDLKASRGGVKGGLAHKVSTK